MTNFELEDESQKYNIPLIGIFNKDTLPSKRVSGAYIINLQDDFHADGQDLSGTHWTAFYIEGNKAVYFDSFAFPPPIQVQNFLKPFIPYDINNVQIQNIQTGYCGSYCISFLKFMIQQRKSSPNLSQRFNKFLHIFSMDVKKNKGILFSRGL